MGNVTSVTVWWIYCQVTLQVYKSKISHFQVAPSLCFKARVSEAIDKNHFHKKGFVVSLTLIVRVFGTRNGLLGLMVSLQFWQQYNYIWAFWSGQKVFKRHPMANVIWQRVFKSLTSLWWRALCGIHFINVSLVILGQLYSCMRKVLKNLWVKKNGVTLN